MFISPTKIMTIICTYHKYITGSTRKYVGYYNNMYVGYLLLLFEIKNNIIDDEVTSYN